MAGPGRAARDDGASERSSEFVVRSRAGDRRAYEALVEELLEPTFEAALAGTGDRSAALDVTAATILRAWSDLPALSDAGRFQAWFGRILRSELAHPPLGARGGATDLRQLRHVIRVALPGERRRGRWRIRVDRLAHPASRIRVPSVSLPIRRRSLSVHRRRRAVAIGGVVLAGAAIVASGAVARLIAPRTPSMGLPAPMVSAAPTVAPTSAALAGPGAASPAAVAAAAEGTLAFVLDGDIWLRAPDGRKWLAVHVDAFRFHSPIWAPGRPLIAFTSDAAEAATFIADVRSGEVRSLGTGIPEAWSPDGRRLVTSSPFRIIDVDTGNESGSSFVPASSTVISGTVAWSPNGSWLAAGLADRDGSNRLVRITVGTVDTGALLRLAPLFDGATARPAWSPDSTRLAFSSSRCRLWHACPDAVNVVDADGVLAREILHTDQPILRLRWAPDGSSIAYSSLSPNESAVDPSHWVARIGIVSAGGSSDQVVAEGAERDFEWALDGRAIDYTTAGPGGRGVLLRMDLASQGRVDLGVTVDDETSFGPGATSFSGSAELDVATLRETTPPARRTPLVIEAPPPGRLALATRSTAIAGLSGGCSPALVDFEGRVTLVRSVAEVNGCSASGWSPDGDVFLATDGTAGWSLISRDGSERSLGLPAGDYWASWSPRGTWVVAGTCTAAPSCADGVVTLVRRDGRVDGILPGVPSWSPDERQVAVLTSAGRVLVGHGVGQDLEDLGPLGAPIAWSPDGRRFAYVVDGQAWVMAIDGATARNVTMFRYGGASWVAWSPDGRYLLVGQGQATFWVISADGATRRPAEINAPFGMGTGVWSPDSAWIAFAEYAAAGGANVILVRREDFAAVLLADAANPVWSPDGRLLAVQTAIESGAPGIDLVNADGSGRTTLVAAGSSAVQPQVWLP